MRLRPLIHGRDHEHGGADPTRIVYEDVGTSGGGGGGGDGIQFGMDNNGDWIGIDANGSATDPTRLTSISIRSNTDAKMELRQTGDADLEISDDGNGDLKLLSLGGGDLLINCSNGTLTLVGDGPLSIRSKHDFVIVSPDGYVTMPNLPTADPHVTNQLWNSSGTLKVSAG